MAATKETLASSEVPNDALEPVTKPIFTWFWILEPRLKRKCEPGDSGSLQQTG